MGIPAFCNIPVILATLCYNRACFKVPGTQTIFNNFRGHSDLNRGQTGSLPLGYTTTILFIEYAYNCLELKRSKIFTHLTALELIVIILILLAIISFLQIPESWDGIDIIFSYSMDEFNK